MKGTTSETGRQIRATSASRYGQSAQKPVLSKSQSVEEIRKKALVNIDSEVFPFDNENMYLNVWTFV